MWKVLNVMWSVFNVLQTNQRIIFCPKISEYIFKDLHDVGYSLNTFYTTLITSAVYTLNHWLLYNHEHRRIDKLKLWTQMFFITLWFLGRCQTYHGAKWDGSRGVVVDSNEVNEEGRPTHHSWDHKGPNEHLLNPSSACIIQTNQTE